MGAKRAKQVLIPASSIYYQYLYALKELLLQIWKKVSGVIVKWDVPDFWLLG